MTTTRTQKHDQKFFCNLCGCEVEGVGHDPATETCSVDLKLLDTGQGMPALSPVEIKITGEEK